MLLAIVGTRSSGKSEVQNYYACTQGFVIVNLELTLSGSHIGRNVPEEHEDTPRSIPVQKKLVFSNPEDLLQHTTENWRRNFVTTDICTQELVSVFVRRPFFLLLNVDAPMATRFLRSGGSSLETFVQASDYDMFGVRGSSETRNSNCLLNLRDQINVHVFNSFGSVLELHEHLDEIDLLNPERMRPGWDTYFMTLASLASLRSNCMKRRVGAVLVRDNRVVSTGYNGTPRGLPNCNEGACSACNSASSKSIECVCLHAEENALLEAGRERVGANAVLYCNTCPCLRCTIKIIQTGVKKVVYNLEYKMDEMSSSLFQTAGIILQKYNPPNKSI